MQNNKRKTIYFSTYDDIKNPYYGGGGAVAVHEIAKRLSVNYDVRVVSWNYSGRKKEVIDGIHYERFGLPTLSPKVAMFAYQMALPFVILNKQYDIWMESFCPPFTTSMLQLFTKKPVIGIVHMLAAEDMERKYKLPFHLIQNIGLKTYRHIIVTSEAVKKKIKKIDKSSSVIVISNGISKLYKPTIHKEKYLLFLGRIEVDQKGLDLLINAFKQFDLQKKGYKLCIAGSGDTKEIMKLKEIISDAGLTKNVMLKGRVSGKIKESLLQNAACVVIPSRFETYSLVALEAFAHGAPVVSFDIEGLSWIPEIAAKKVSAFSVSKLAKAFASIVTNKDISITMVKAGNAYAKGFTWEKIAKEYDENIEKVTKNFKL